MTVKALRTLLRFYPTDYEVVIEFGMDTPEGLIVERGGILSLGICSKEVQISSFANSER